MVVKQESTKSRSKIILKVLAILGAGLVVLIAATIFVFTWQGSTKEIISVANTFQPDKSWEMTGENITPPMLVCVSGSCPYIHRNWELNVGDLSQDEVNRYINSAGWHTLDDSNCSDAFSGRRGQTSCLIDGITNDNKYSFMLSIELEGQKDRIALYIKSEN